MGKVLDEWDLQVFKQIREKDPQYVGNIVLNLTGCNFCNALGIDDCEGKTSCTQHIDNFLREYGKEKDA